MGLIKLIVLVTIAWLLWRLLVKHWLNKKVSNTRLAQRMVKCAHCNVHIPEAEALAEQQLFFCSAVHKQQYLQKK